MQPQSTISSFAPFTVCGRWAHVQRPQTVRVEALDENGVPVNLEATDALAKCLCHEIDHLDGVVLADRAIDYVSLP